jgi:DNA mismatch endonuclease (patch repair protein)
MADVFNKDKRSEIMRLVKSKNGKSTELKLLKFFLENEIKGWRRTYPLIGKPDFVFPKKRLAIFVDGCFWHGHDCRNTKPSSNTLYWERKISNNIKRDLDVVEQLVSKKWTVLRIWECQLKSNETLKQILSALVVK